MHQLNWQPGSEGKGLIVNGDVHTWSTDEYGDPHHAEYIGQDVNDDTINVQRNHQAFYITPRGDVTFSLISGGEDDPRLIEQADPRLKPDYNYHKNWDFSGAAKVITAYNKNPRQGNSAFATELKLWLDGFNPEKAMQDAWVTPHHESPWDFVSQYDEDEEAGWGMDDMTGPRPWSEGQYGKGVIVWGKQPTLHTWGTGEDADGQPAHAEVLDPYMSDAEQNGPGRYKRYYPFWITPEGEVEHPVMPDAQVDRDRATALIQQQQPELTHPHEEWDFKLGVRGDPMQPGVWDLAEGEPETPPGLLNWKEETGEELTPQGVNKRKEHAWPFVHDKGTGNTYVGGEGWYHEDIMDKLPHLRQYTDSSDPLYSQQLVLGRVNPGEPITYYGVKPSNKELDHIEPRVIDFLQRRHKLDQEAIPKWDFGQGTAEDWDFNARLGVGTDKPKPKPVRKRPEGLSDNEWEQMKLDWAQSDDGEGRPYPFPPQPEHWRHDHAPDVHFAAYEFSINNTLQDLGHPPEHEIEDWEPGHSGKVLLEKNTGNVHIVKSDTPWGDEYSHVELAEGRGIPRDMPMWAGWIDPKGKYFGNLIPRKHMNSVFDQIELQGGNRGKKVNEWGDWNFEGGAPKKPPHYREADKSTETCGNCKMFHHGKCWGYANIPVRKDHVCDSWAKDK